MKWGKEPPCRAKGHNRCTSDAIGAKIWTSASFAIFAEISAQDRWKSDKASYNSSSQVTFPEKFFKQFNMSRRGTSWFFIQVNQFCALCTFSYMQMETSLWTPYVRPSLLQSICMSFFSALRLILTKSGGMLPGTLELRSFNLIPCHSFHFVTWSIRSTVLVLTCSILLLHTFIQWWICFLCWKYVLPPN